MLCGSLGLAGGRILRGTAPKARRDGANASFFRIRPSVYIQAELEAAPLSGGLRALCSLAADAHSVFLQCGPNAQRANYSSCII